MFLELEEVISFSEQNRYFMFAVSFFQFWKQRIFAWESEMKRIFVVEVLKVWYLILNPEPWMEVNELLSGNFMDNTTMISKTELWFHLIKHVLNDIILIWNLTN